MSYDWYDQEQLRVKTPTLDAVLAIRWQYCGQYPFFKPDELVISPDMYTDLIKEASVHFRLFPLRSGALEICGMAMRVDGSKPASYIEVRNCLRGFSVKSATLNDIASPPDKGGER